MMIGGSADFRISSSVNLSTLNTVSNQGPGGKAPLDAKTLNHNHIKNKNDNNNYDDRWLSNLQNLLIC